LKRASLSTRNSRGFSLIELVVVLTIAAILAAVAIPNFSDHLSRARRLRAQADLLEAAQYLQRFRSVHGSFAGAELPAALKHSPADGHPNYAISLVVIDGGAAYRLTARPAGSQTRDACGSLALHANGRKSNASAMAVSACWK
jgi:type IV pilus assembly protein PilE